MAAYVRQHSSGWKNPVHAAQWVRSVATHVSPLIGRMSVADVVTAHIIKVLTPIWDEKTETASRLRGRIELVLDWATVSGYRTGDNPARWSGHLENVFASPSKIRPVKHMLSLAYAEFPGFMSELRAREGMAALALQFVILTCVRTSDLRSAKREHVNRTERTWLIPSFSKTGAVHRVPLSDAALAVIDKAERIAIDIGGAVGASPFLFPSDVTGAALDKNAMLKVLDRLGRKGQMTTTGAALAFALGRKNRRIFRGKLPNGPSDTALELK